MAASILDGKALAEQIRAEIAQEVAAFRQPPAWSPAWRPCWSARTRPARSTSATSRRPASRSELQPAHRPPADTTTDELLALIDRLNRDPAVHGILVQLPLPKGIDERRVLRGGQIR